MIGWRVIPCLLYRAGGLYKTTRFSAPRYVGDPINTLRILNDKEVDEVIVIDIEAGRDGRPIQFDAVADLASECFMPLSYGGGVRSIEEARRLFSIGLEKICVNTAAFQDPELITRVADEFGSQSVVLSVDVKRSKRGVFSPVRPGESRSAGIDLRTHVEEAVGAGVGEVFVTSIDREGTGLGYDLELIEEVAKAVQVPVVAHGGAGGMDDFSSAFQAGASAVAAGSAFVFQGPHRAVLISYPTQREQAEVFSKLRSARTPPKSLG